MKIKLSTLVLAALLYSMSSVTPVMAHAGHSHSDSSSTVPQSAEGDGVVKAIDAEAGTVTLAHGPIAVLNWPAMTMAFHVESAAVLNGIAVGNNVHFTLENKDGKPIVTDIDVK